MESQRRQKFQGCRYKWLIRPVIHQNAIASLDWIGKSAPVPLRAHTHTHTHTHTHLRTRARLDDTQHHPFWVVQYISLTSPDSVFLIKITTRTGWCWTMQWVVHLKKQTLSIQKRTCHACRPWVRSFVFANVFALYTKCLRLSHKHHLNCSSRPWFFSL